MYIYIYIYIYILTHSRAQVSDALTTKSAVDVTNATGDQRVSFEFEALCTGELRNLMVVPIFRSSKCPGVGLLILVNKLDGQVRILFSVSMCPFMYISVYKCVRV